MWNSESDERKEVPRARIGSHGGGGREEVYSITLEGLNRKEYDVIQAMMAGQLWVSAKPSIGRLEFADATKPAPSPIDDVEMLPFWRKETVLPAPGTLKVQRLDQSEKWPPFSPSIVIQHLCGYGYTPEFYKRVAKQLEEYGFECLRSRRGAEGRFWEIWFLPFLEAARGELKETLARNRNQKSDLDVVVSFLCNHVSFGTLDVSIQRAGMPVPD